MTSSLKKTYMNWLPAIGMMVIIFISSSTPGRVVDASPFASPLAQIRGHLVLFFLLCLSYYIATKNIFISILLTVFYGVADELHQIFTPWRSPSLFDVKVDTLAALLAGGVLWILPKRLKNWLTR